MNYAVIENGKVVNAIVGDPDLDIPGMQLAPLTGSAWIGWSWSKATGFTPPISK